MTGWMAHFLSSFADQPGTWFVGTVLALLGLFSARILENIKFALNRADLRVKYYEEMATEISHFLFIIDRLTRVYYGSAGTTPEDKDAIAGEYNEVMNAISRKERAVDVLPIRLNDAGDQKEKLVTELWSAFRDLQTTAHSLLLTAI